MNLHTTTAVMLGLVTLASSACVSQSAYDVAVADREATQAEIDNTKTQSHTLTEQVTELQQHQLIIARQIDATTLAFRQAAKQRDAEHAALHKRLSRLSYTIRQLSAQQNSLRYAIQREHKSQPKLQALVEQFQSQLGEATAAAAPVSGSLVSLGNQPLEPAPPAQVAMQTDPTPQTAVTTPAPPVKPVAANPASSPRPPVVQPPQPEESDWLSTIKEWFRSILFSLFP